MLLKQLVVFVAILAVSVVLFGQVAYAQWPSEATMRDFRNPDGSTIPDDMRFVRGSGTLLREKRGITVEVKTTGLEADSAYTNWWVIFNNPNECADSCGGADFANPAVQGSVLYATGGVSDGSGNATFRAFLPVGLVRLNSGEDIRHPFGPGLQDPQKAEVHYLIRSHGKAVYSGGRLSAVQVGTLNGLCDPDLPAGCYDPQSGVFPKPAGFDSDVPPPPMDEPGECDPAIEVCP